MTNIFALKARLRYSAPACLIKVITQLTKSLLTELVIHSE